MMRRATHGFTLLETLVVLVLVGMIILVLAQGTRFGLAGVAISSRWSDRDDEQRTTDRLLRALVERMDTGDQLADDVPIDGTRERLTFGTELPAVPPGGRTADVVATLLVARHRLILRWAPHYAAPLGRRAPPVDTILSDRIDHIEIAYWKPDKSGARWAATWRGNTLPALVRFRIVPIAAKGVAWPDIVAAPLRAMNSPA